MRNIFASRGSRRYPACSRMLIAAVLATATFQKPVITMTASCRYKLSIEGSERKPTFHIIPIYSDLCLHGINIAEFDKNYEYSRTAWHLRNKAPDGKIIGSLTYGIVPNGWTEAAPAVDLKPNIFYSFDACYYFRKEGSGKYLILNQTQFLDRKLHRSLWKD